MKITFNVAPDFIMEYNVNDDSTSICKLAELIIARNYMLLYIENENNDSYNSNCDIAITNVNPNDTMIDNLMDYCIGDHLQLYIEMNAKFKTMSAYLENLQPGSSTIKKISDYIPKYIKALTNVFNSDDITNITTALQENESFQEYAKNIKSTDSVYTKFINTYYNEIDRLLGYNNDNK